MCILSIYLPTYLSTDLPTYLSIYLSISVSLSLSLSLPVFISLYSSSSLAISSIYITYLAILSNPSNHLTSSCIHCICILMTHHTVYPVTGLKDIGSIAMHFTLWAWSGMVYKMSCAILQIRGAAAATVGRYCQHVRNNAQGNQL